MKDVIINIEHVSKQFGDKVVLDDINLQIKKGEFITFLGPSGCGKTTLLRIIGGFHLPTDGKVEMEGKDLLTLPPHKRPLNTVFQRYALFPHLDVYDNVAFGLKLKKEDNEDIAEKVTKVLRMVGMSDYEDRDVNSLSGGQQQR
ncbi:MAG: ATP-binding cassette domain-containing protein, partial [Bacteroidales bacterium]|nr:ATP-binding cassette domain-containing protein [Bacteroidales bacterium]